MSIFPCRRTDSQHVAIQNPNAKTGGFCKTLAKVALIALPALALGVPYITQSPHQCVSANLLGIEGTQINLPYGRTVPGYNFCPEKPSSNLALYPEAPVCPINGASPALRNETVQNQSYPSSPIVSFVESLLPEAFGDDPEIAARVASSATATDASIYSDEFICPNEAPDNFTAPSAVAQRANSSAPTDVSSYSDAFVCPNEAPENFTTDNEVVQNTGYSPSSIVGQTATSVHLIQPATAAVTGPIREGVQTGALLGGLLALAASTVRWAMGTLRRSPAQPPAATEPRQEKEEVFEPTQRPQEERLPIPRVIQESENGLEHPEDEKKIPDSWTLIQTKNQEETIDFSNLQERDNFLIVPEFFHSNERNSVENIKQLRLEKGVVNNTARSFLRDMERSKKDGQQIIRLNKQVLGSNSADYVAEQIPNLKQRHVVTSVAQQANFANYLSVLDVACLDRDKQQIEIQIDSKKGTNIFHISIYFECQEKPVEDGVLARRFKVIDKITIDFNTDRITKSTTYFSRDPLPKLRRDTGN